ncbi:septal ring lytic transglycosylase RlpA family protein [Actinoallomurus rhizosphaericola]|uniref:septal ring lytic transglycosylase RlpA family protein n=1 Tax=Actinoallomurus rhizosphaericola TaxID=2952536 RepID=UPI002093272F|nr:septal ring lytic transglycosylase RlpA family protein [Actinoallomurus rhizosphaericola]MCO5994882.1 septal ring lytic transglycosylase RlpA family protein [Actinoallomurus rhizosphaericola]
MGGSGRHRQVHRSARLRTGLLTAAGLAAATLAATVATLIGSGRSAPRADVGAAVVPAAPPHLPGRAARALRRVPVRTRPVRRRAARRPARRAPKTRVLGGGSCEASFYAAGPATASGAPYDPEALTAAHRTLPMGSRVRVTNLSNARSVVVRINDRGPFVPGRCLDLSAAAMRAIGGVLSGVIPVRYEVLAAV